MSSTELVKAVFNWWGIFGMLTAILLFRRSAQSEMVGPQILWLILGFVVAIPTLEISGYIRFVDMAVIGLAMLAWHVFVGPSKARLAMPLFLTAILACFLMNLTADSCRSFTISHTITYELAVAGGYLVTYFIFQFVFREYLNNPIAERRRQRLAAAKAKGD